MEVPLLYTEDDILVLCTEERVCSLHRGGSVPLLFLEEADSLSSVCNINTGYDILGSSVCVSDVYHIPTLEWL